jgi:hypothetical protein
MISLNFRLPAAQKSSRSVSTHDELAGVFPCRLKNLDVGAKDEPFARDARIR